MNRRASINSTQDMTRLSRSNKHKKRASLVLYIVLFIVFLAICLFFASNTITRTKAIPIKYSQNGNIDYKVYLNKNNFYTEKYLDMNKSYVASLINYVDINFNYVFNINQKTTMDFDYKIIGELVIENSKGNGRYLEKEYTLLDTKIRKLVQDKALTIKENIKIDYGYYNQLANSFKSTYGVDINSYLNVYLEIEPKTSKDLNYKINETNKISLKIPLSEKAIEINLDASNQNSVKHTTISGETKLSILFLILEILFFIPTCILLIKIINRIFYIVNDYTPFDKYVKKKLKEYDRLIVETDSELNTKGYNVIEIKNFTELLDARDNLNLPILYLNTIPHEEGIFYILSNNDIYMLTIKNDDLDKK